MHNKFMFSQMLKFLVKKKEGRSEAEAQSIQRSIQEHAEAFVEARYAFLSFFLSPAWHCHRAAKRSKSAASSSSWLKWPAEKKARVAKEASERGFSATKVCVCLLSVPECSWVFFFLPWSVCMCMPQMWYEGEYK